MDEKQSNLASSDVEAENPPPRRKSIFAFLFLVRHVENSIFQKSSEHGYIYKSGVDVTIIGYQDQQEQLPHNVDSRKDISAHSLVVTDFQTITKSAQLKLEGSFVYLREVLHPGCLYILSEMYSELRDSILLKARNTLNLKPIVTVTSSMNLIRVSEHGTTLSLINKESVALSASTPLERAIDGARTSFMRNCPLETVEQALSDINTRKSHERGRSANTGLVNFRGVIVQREYRKSNVSLQQLPNGLVDIPRFGPAKLSDLETMNLGFCFIGNQTIVLKIQDVDSMNSVMVYLDLSRTSYIRGLIPGAVIQFRRLQKKYSQKGNAYCRFDVCSSLKVEQVAPARDSASSESGPFLGPKTQGSKTDTKRSPNANIVDLIRYGSRGRLIQTIVRVRCRVTNVQWAMLQWTCCKCGHSVIKEECSATCGMSSGYKFNAELRCLIEDGTGEAQLYLYDELVPLLLKLTSQGWSCLQALVMNTGKVEYQRNSYGGRPKAMRSGGNLLSRHSEAKSTLEENCQSPVVRRLLNVHCKHFRWTSNRGETSAQSGGTGFDSRSITIGAMEHKTLTLPKLYLKAVAIDDVNCVQEIKCLLKWNYSPPSASDF